MKKKNSNEELQSRREFFKKAAKSALPILGAIALSGTPTIVTAMEASPMGCNSGCTATCEATCKGACSGGCKETCYNQCYTRCKDTCKSACSGTCKGSCNGR